MAYEYDLPTKSRKDSRGICFLGQFKFNEFVKAHLGENPGPLVEYETGKLLGTHKGFWFHTSIGERQGSGLAGGPWYVVAKNPAHNEVVLSRHYYSSDKQRNQFAVDQLHWFAEKRPEKTTMQVKIRHGKQFHTGDIAYLSQTHVMVTLRDHDQGIAPGQFAVFYDDRSRMCWIWDYKSIKLKLIKNIAYSIR